MHVRMSDEVQYVKVIVVVGLISHDPKSRGAICARYGGKNCHHQVSRFCMMGYKDLDDSLCPCFLVSMCDLETLHKGASNPRVSKKEREKHSDALKLMSCHFIDNAIFHVDLGSNQYGVRAGTAMDMMQLCKSGIFKYLLNVFTDSMSNGTKAKIDTLIEKLFIPIRSSKRKDFSRINFKGGVTSLMMLSSQHWPGMMLLFCMMLLTPEERNTSKDCFQDEDMEIPKVDWDEAPEFDMNQVHVLVILGEVQWQSHLISSPHLMMRWMMMMMRLPRKRRRRTQT